MTAGVNDIQVEAAEPRVDHLKNVDLHDKALNSDAHEATVQEHTIGLLQAFKTYKRAAFWAISRPPRFPENRPHFGPGTPGPGWAAPVQCLTVNGADNLNTVISMSIVMEGYDLTLISSFYGQVSNATSKEMHLLISS